MKEICKEEILDAVYDFFVKIRDKRNYLMDQHADDFIWGLITRISQVKDISKKDQLLLIHKVICEVLIRSGYENTSRMYEDLIKRDNNVLNLFNGKL